MAELQPIIIKKKKGGHGGHHGGSWKVAYADFVTAMMAFFMVMWIMSMSPETKTSIQGYFNDPLGFAKNEPKMRSIMALKGSPNAASTSSGKGRGDYPSAVGAAAEAEHKEIQGVEAKIKQALEGAHDLNDLLKDVKITETPEGLLIQLVETRGAVFFESGSTTIRPGARKLIAQIAHVLADSKRKLVVQGHTDAAPFAGSKIGNWQLSTQRALALQSELFSGGVTPEQVQGVSGYADTRLLEPDKPLDFSNRRVTILLPKVYKEGDEASAPGDDLKNSIKAGTSPEAVDIGPQKINLQEKKKHYMF